MVDAVILGETANTLSAARSLGRSGLEVAVASTIYAPDLAASRYVRAYERLPDGRDTDICAALLALGASEDRPFLMPTSDRFALLIAEHQALLETRYCFVCPPYETLLDIVDKGQLYATARRVGIRHPAFCIVARREDIEEAVATIPTPCYVKPNLAHKWRQVRKGKLERANSKFELREILRGAMDDGIAVAAQEIIPGSDSEIFTVYTYIDRHGTPLAWRTCRKLRQWPLRAGDGCMRETVDMPEVAELGLRLLSITGHRGAGYVEFRRDARDGALVLMEINARTGFGQECVAHSGLDVPGLAYRDARGLQQPSPLAGPVVPTRWVNFEQDFRAYRQLWRDGALTTREWLSSLWRCNAYAYFAADDPLPCLHRWAQWIGGVLSNRFLSRPAAGVRQSKHPA